MLAAGLERSGNPQNRQIEVFNLGPPDQNFKWKFGEPVNSMTVY